MGTPSYMAPEQAGAKSGQLGPATDVYALGAILYECLTGRPPFRAATQLDTILQVISDEPVPPTQLQPKTPRDLGTICLKCLQKDPRQRYASAAALAADLRRFQQGEPIRARPVGRVERAWRWCRRNPARAALAAALLLGTPLGTGLTVWALRERGQTKEAQVRAENDLLDGLLRPIGHDWKPEWKLNPGPNSGEEQALADLARLDSRLRLRFLERGLSQPETAECLARNSGPVIKAVVGEDTETKKRVRDLALAALRKGDAYWYARVAGTCLLLSLGESMTEYAREGTLALAARIASIDAEDRTRPRDALSYMTLLAALAHHLNASDARDVGRPLLDLARESPDPNGSYLLNALGSVAARMEAADAATVCGDAARTLVERILRKKRGGGELAYVAPYVTAADATDAATRLAQAIPNKTNDSYAHFELATAIANLAPRLPDADAARVCRVAAAQLIQDIPKGAFIDGFNARVVGTLGQHMDAAEAAKLGTEVVPPLVQDIMNPKEERFQQTKSIFRVEFVEALAPCMDPATARDAATLLISQAIRNKPAVGYNPNLVARAVAALAQRLDATEAAKVCADAAAPLVESIPTAREFEVPNLAKALAQLARRMDPAGRAKLCAAVLPSLVRAVSKEKALLSLPHLADAVAELAPSMAAAERAKVTATTAAALLDALDSHMRVQTPDLLVHLELGTGPSESHAVHAFGALSKQMAPRDVADLLGRRELSPRVTDGMLRELASVAGHGFQTIDEAVRWFRDRAPAPQAP
jgi:hypothetical protein